LLQNLIKHHQQEVEVAAQSQNIQVKKENILKEYSSTSNPKILAQQMENQSRVSLDMDGKWC